MNKSRSSVPIIAVVLLLLPVLYVASYLALLNPLPYIAFKAYRLPGKTARYRVGGLFAERFYWPLEQVDRALRPGTWNPDGYVF